MTVRSLAIIVKPNIPPNIRPPAVQVPAQPDEEEDVLSISGSRGQVLNFDIGQSYSATFTDKQAEQYRIFDRVRVINPRRPPADGNPNNARQYVDIEITHYLQYRNEFGQLIVEKFAKPKTIQGVQYVMEENIKRGVTPAERN